MKIILILAIVMLCGCNGNKSSRLKIDSVNDSVQTWKINPTGTYRLDSKTEIKDGDTYGYFGSIQVKKIEEDKIVISFSVNKGAPSYNMGGFIDTLKFENNKSIYLGFGNTSNCKIEFTFSDNGITVSEGEGNECGFGHGVYAGGFFTKTSSIVPILEDPFTSRRIKPTNSIYSEMVKTGNSLTPKTEIYNMLWGVKLVGLELQKGDTVNSYAMDFSTVCMCEGLSILMQRDKKKVYIFPYCNEKPMMGSYNNWEYNITSIDFIDGKMAVKGIDKNSDDNELVFVFQVVDNINVFSLETEGDKPNVMWLNKYISHRKDLFEFDCGDFDG